MKTRLIKNAATTVVYEATTPVELFKTDDVEYARVDVSYAELSAKAKRGLTGALGEFNQVFTSNLPKDLSGLVANVTLAVTSAGVTTTVEATRELSEVELDDLGDALVAQFADGFGENLEQTPFYEQEIKYQYEEEDGEGNVSPAYADAVDQFFCVLYPGDVDVNLARK